MNFVCNILEIYLRKISCNLLTEHECRIKRQGQCVAYIRTYCVLLLSRYTDTAAIIKQEANVYVEYRGQMFSESSTTTTSQMADLLDTSNFILVSYKKVSTRLLNFL